MWVKSTAKWQEDFLQGLPSFQLFSKPPILLTWAHSALPAGGGEWGPVRMAESWVQGKVMWEIMTAGPSQLLCLGAVLAAMCNWIIEIRGEGWGARNRLQHKQR